MGLGETLSQVFVFVMSTSEGEHVANYEYVEAREICNCKDFFIYGVK